MGGSKAGSNFRIQRRSIQSFSRHTQGPWKEAWRRLATAFRVPVMSSASAEAWGLYGTRDRYSSQA